MSGRTLWYVRHGGHVTGPFPARAIRDDVLVGRVRPDDEASADQVEWLPVAQVRELQPDGSLDPQTVSDPVQMQWREERLKAARRWADERTHAERLGESGSEERRHAGANPDELALPHHHAPPAQPSGKRRYLPAAGGVLLLSALALAVFHFQPVDSLKVGVMPSPAPCRQAAAPGVDWNACDKRGAALGGADLSHANLSYGDFQRADLSGASLRQARLTGAILRLASLARADLSGADLSYGDLGGANLEGSNLTGTVLDRAIWPDGRVCAAGSLGQCR